MAHFSSGVEDIVVEIYKRIFYFMEKENESSDFRFATYESVQMSTSARMVKSTALTNFLTNSSSVSPGLRARLVRLCLDAILQNQWTLVCVEPFFKILFSLLCGSPSEYNGASDNQPESDVALFALREFWTRFMHSYNELKSGKLCNLSYIINTMLFQSKNIIFNHAKPYKPGKKQQNTSYVCMN